MEMQTDNNGLTVRPKSELLPKSETEYLRKAMNAQITFVKDAAGRVPRAIHQQWGPTIEAPKINDPIPPPGFHTLELDWQGAGLRLCRQQEFPDRGDILPDPVPVAGIARIKLRRPNRTVLVGGGKVVLQAFQSASIAAIA